MRRVLPHEYRKLLSNHIMSEQTNLFLASLSHRWQVVILATSVLLGVLAYATGVLQKRIRPHFRETIPTWLRFLRFASIGGFVTSLPFLAASIFHIGCAGLVAHETSCQSNL